MLASRQGLLFVEMYDKRMDLPGKRSITKEALFWAYHGPLSEQIAYLQR